MLEKLDKFRPWIQKIMPTVFDDSLTYYDALAKAIGFMNNVNDQCNEIIDYLDTKFDAEDTAISQVRADFISFQTSVNNAFTSFQTTINSDYANFELAFDNFKNEVTSITVPANVESILNSWYDNGKLANIINNDVFNMKANQVDLDTTNSQLAENTTDVNNVIGSKYRMTFNKNQLGVNIQNPMDLTTLQSKFTLMQQLGIHNIVLLPQGNLATYTSTTITEDTISYATLESYIQACQNAGFTVYLKCHIECTDGTWRASIAPSDINAFFTNYQAFIVKYAGLAEKYKLPIFCLGEEMKSITTSTYSTQWTNIVNAVKAVYTGKLTYGANCNGYTDEYNNGNVVFPLVDYLGVDLWATQNDVNGGRIANYNGLNGWIIPQLENLYNTTGKKIILTEIGYFPTPEGANQPSNASVQTWGSLDYNFHAQYYDMMFSNFIGQEWLEDIWYWAETNNSYSAGGSPDRFSVLVDGNTATQSIFKQYKEVSL